jgi:hypothetical protein
MGIRSALRIAFAPVILGCALSAGCDHHCGLGERARLTTTESQAGPVAVAGAAFRDLALAGKTSDAEFSLANTAFATEPAGVDAFLVSTSCQRLFDGAYPGAAPLCPILAGPAKPGGVSARVKLTPGTYRLYLQGYSSATGPVSRYLVDVYVWDYSCGAFIQ